MPMTLKDMARLDPSTVQMWNGTKWTRVLGTSKSQRRGTELEFVLRSGETISCTPTHRFPTTRGVVSAREIVVGDCLTQVRLPQPDVLKDCALDEDAAWFAGLYIAEGSMADDTIQIAGHVKEAARWECVQRIAHKYGGTATRTVNGNCADIRVYGKVLVAVLAELVRGKTAHNKAVANVVWRYSDKFLDALLDGYLSGDAHVDKNRWRLGFCRNGALAQDLRTLCARLGYTLTLNTGMATFDGKLWPIFRGELRKTRTGYRTERTRTEVVAIRKARCRYVYDVGVEDAPHVFALASGILTHNSKPNPMPESVTDRCTKSHEYMFLLTKQPKYFYDHEGAKEPAAKGAAGSTFNKGKTAEHQLGRAQTTERTQNEETRNRRDVWTIATQPYKEAHFAVFPEALVRPCLLAGTSRHGCCPTCGEPYRRVVEHTNMRIRRSERTHEKGQTRASGTVEAPATTTTTTGWTMECNCPEAPAAPCTVLDPFMGSGTTGAVCKQLGLEFVGVELNSDYIKLARRRIVAAKRT